MNQGVVEWEDLDGFFDTDYFAVSATLQIGIDVLNLEGIFDTPFAQRDFGAFIADSDDPTFVCKWRNEFNDAEAGDILTLKNETFYLKTAPQSDGTGVVVLTLIRATTQDTVGDDVPEAPDKPGRKLGGGGLFSPNRGGD